MTDKDEEFKIRGLAEAHIDWFLNAIRPLLIDNFIHGYKHGKESDEQPKGEGE